MSAHTVTDTDGWPRPSRPTPGTGRLYAGVEGEGGEGGEGGVGGEGGEGGEGGNESIFSSLTGLWPGAGADYYICVDCSLWTQKCRNTSRPDYTQYTGSRRCLPAP